MARQDLEQKYNCASRRENNRLHRPGETAEPQAKSGLCAMPLFPCCSLVAVASMAEVRPTS